MFEVSLLLRPDAWTLDPSEDRLTIAADDGFVHLDGNVPGELPRFYAECAELVPDSEIAGYAAKLTRAIETLTWIERFADCDEAAARAAETLAVIR